MKMHIATKTCPCPDAEAWGPVHYQLALSFPACRQGRDDGGEGSACIHGAQPNLDLLNRIVFPKGNHKAQQGVRCKAPAPAPGAVPRPGSPCLHHPGSG